MGCTVIQIGNSYRANNCRGQNFRIPRTITGDQKPGRTQLASTPTIKGRNITTRTLWLLNIEMNTLLDAKSAVQWPRPWSSVPILRETRPYPPLCRLRLKLRKYPFLSCLEIATSRHVRIPSIYEACFHHLASCTNLPEGLQGLRNLLLSLHN